MRWILSVLAICVLTVLSAQSQGKKENQDPNADLGKVAAELASKLGPELVKRGPEDKNRKFRVAVFNFGNAEGKYPLEMGDNGPILRGALVDELRLNLDKHAAGKFSILYPEQIDDKIKEVSSDVDRLSAGLDDKKLPLARRLMKDLDIQVAIVGRFEVSKKDFASNEVSSNWGSFISHQRDEQPAFGTKIVTRAILAKETVEKSATMVFGGIKDFGFGPGGSGRSIGRVSVGVELLVNDKFKDTDPRAWKSLPLSVSKKEENAGLYYLVLPKEAKNKRYRIVLTNHGKPKAYTNFDKPELDAERIFGVSVLIDGVSSFMRQDENKEYRHVSGHPGALPKWVLTPVGKRLVPDEAGIKGRLKGGKFEATAADGASANVLGFQKGSEKAGAFIFAEPQDSVGAPELLAIRKIGTISAYVYAEKLPGDAETVNVAGGGAGTKMGEDVRSRTFSVKVLNWHNDPTQVVRIIYRYKGDESLPNDLTEVK